jgi:UDP-GlcNAc:undecaprenyl-phosphate GlcNAc-1-phosphate transferase
VLAAFHLAEKRGFRFSRAGVFDLAVKQRLKIVRDKSLVIRAVFPPLEYGLPLMFVAGALAPAAVPPYVAACAAALCLSLALVWLLRRGWAAAVLRAAIYLLVPILLWAGQAQPMAWWGVSFATASGPAWGLLAFFMVMTLKFTRRRQGFKATPMDFLIVLIALVVPNLPDPAIASVEMGSLATGLIVMFFGFEVLIGELRGRIGRLVAGVMAGLAVLAVRGLF